MICDLCHAGFTLVGEPLAEVFLLHGDDGYALAVGMHGERFVLPEAPFPDPIVNDGEGLSDDSPYWERSQEWIAAAEKFSDAFLAHYASYGVKFFWEIYQAALAVGYNPDEDGYFEMWLFDRLGEAVTSR